MTGNRLGLSTGAFWPHAGTAEAPALVARLGVRDVEVMLQSTEEYQPAFAGELRQAFDVAGASVRSVHVKQALHLVFSDVAAEVADGWDLFDRAIGASVTLGASLLVWHGPSLRHEADVPALMARFPAAAAQLAERCVAAGVTLTVENVSYCALPTVRDARRYAERLDASGDDQTGFTFDPFQAAEAGANPFLMLAAMGRRLRNVHLSDYRSASGTSGHAIRHLPPGKGELPWPALLRAVATGYDGPLMLESPLGPDPEETFRRVAAFLDPLIAAAGGDVLATGELPPGVREGIALFNTGAYYEAHEAIEFEWHAERGSIRRLYQGILQIGIGVHHARNGNRSGAILKLTDGITKVSEFAPAVAGIDTARLVSDAAAYLSAVIEVDGNVDKMRAIVPPQIRVATRTA
jgi:sugar phosphate isomerase/epimerase